MKYLIITLFLLAGINSFGQDILLDKIAAKVDNHYILNSDIVGLEAQYQAQGKGTTAPNKCQILENLVIAKLMLAKAEIDSVTVEDKRVDAQLAQRMEYFIQQFGSEKNIVEAYGKSINQLKNELRTQVKEQMLVQKMNQKITEAVKITPEEVRNTFAMIPKDSLPFIPAEVEVGQIVRLAKLNHDQKSALRKRLLDYREQVLKGSASFEALAKEFSEDVGSAKQGGDLGFAKRGMMVPEFEAAAMKLEINGISDVVESDFGLHLIQLLEKRGQEYHARHILLRPDYAKLDLTEATNYLDSVRNLIVKDSITFEKAAKKFSEDKNTADAGGWIAESETNSIRLPLDASMNPALFFAIDTMKVGSISPVMSYRTEDGKTGVRLLYYKVKYPSHHANMHDDYSKISVLAMNRKKQEIIESWFKKSKNDIYIRLEEDFAECKQSSQVLQD